MRPIASRGNIWLLDLNPTRGHEQAGRRPGLIVSVDMFNHGPADLLVIVPLTTKDKRNPLHVVVQPPEAGLKQRSFVKCEDIRSVAKERLISRWGTVSAPTITQVEDRLRVLLSL